VAKITYADKTNPNAVTSRGTQATAEDFNEIKTSVNAAYDTIDPFFNQVTVTETGDDAGITFENQISVGTPSAGKESVFGEGDSYHVPIAFHCDVANTTGLTITSATDVTDILQSDSESDTGLFDGTTAGLYLLVGSDNRFGGVKTKLSTTGVIEPANIIGEYLPSSSGWAQTPFMATDADQPYTQKGWSLATCSSCSEQWRFGFDPDNLPTPWVPVTLTINGTEYTKYWARLRITSAITTDALVEQIKLHTNRMEINADGASEYFGRARYPKTLIFGLDNAVANALNTPGNEDVAYGADFDLARVRNKFQNVQKHGFGLVQNIEEGLDTSIPLKLTVSYYVEGTATGDVELEADVYTVSDGFVYDGTATPANYPVIDTVASASNLVRRSVDIKFFANQLTPNDAIVIHLFRDATAGNPDDTVSANIVITNVTLTGYFWRP